jgi:hypothetical protein
MSRARRSDREFGLKRTAEMAAIFMIGDGVLGIAQPRRHVDLWRSRLKPIDLLVRPFGEGPTRRRVYGVVQVATGLLLAGFLKPRSGRKDDA